MYAKHSHCRQANSFSADQEIFRGLWNQDVLYRVGKNLHHFSLSQTIAVLPLQFILRSILILYSHLRAAESVVKQIKRV